MNAVVVRREQQGAYRELDNQGAAPGLPRWGFAELFVISQTFLPALLFIPGTQALRTPIRIAAFGISLVAFAVWFQRRRRGHVAHPAEPWLIGCVLYLCLMLFHPNSNTLVSGVAQILLYFAVFAPLFWAPSLVQSPQHLRRLLALLLVCNGINAIVGILQVYDPGTWLPAEFSRLVASPDSISRFYYRGADGQMIVRPPGLFDTPGAVAAAGTCAGLLGVIFALHHGPIWRRALAMGLAFAGVVSIYLSHVRTNFVILLGMVVILVMTLGLRRQSARAAVVLGMFVVLAAGAFTVATNLVGDTIGERFGSLIEDDPLTVYQRNRGVQLEQGFQEYLSDYPFGAGLGRWGMMGFYFGNPEDPESKPLWAEIQFPGWILDGGIVLVALYCGALFRVVQSVLRLTRQTTDESLRFWSIAILASNGGILLLMLSFVPFCSQIGLQFWFLSGALWGVQQNQLFSK